MKFSERAFSLFEEDLIVSRFLFPRVDVFLPSFTQAVEGCIFLTSLLGRCLVWLSPPNL